MNISSVSADNERFPADLLHADPSPKSINILGELPNEPMVAIVGTRRCTPYGRQVAYDFAAGLAKSGVTVVSGLAIGIDAVAHQAALDAGGKTVAVVAHGLDRVYPSSHRRLAEEIVARGGALLSEYPSGTPPLKHQFLERNRLIATLTLGTVVIEAPIHSGALSTARRARDIGRSVMAVPGNITSEISQGPNSLIKDGATPVTSLKDILEELNLTHLLKPTGVQSDPLLRLIQTGARTDDELILRSGLSAPELAHDLSLLEIAGKIRQLGDGWVIS